MHAFTAIFQGLVLAQAVMATPVADAVTDNKALDARDPMFGNAQPNLWEDTGATNFAPIIDDEYAGYAPDIAEYKPDLGGYKGDLDYKADTNYKGCKGGYNNQVNECSAGNPFCCSPDGKGGNFCTISDSCDQTIICCSNFNGYQLCIGDLDFTIPVTINVNFKNDD
ncbi:hypothetical protein B0I35DRAFT_515443 [Stachybotrys elegans]|uniref:Hydrophobin n=1 Tax=Stachybotrys elegans TaxID=80388 RepID=A0A8K0SLQ6_9HYPO|nr:hypothetical protein B0I35DRAFT_515443 [Stachybotrys elegans]